MTGAASWVAIAPEVTLAAFALVVLVLNAMRASVAAQSGVALVGILCAAAATALGIAPVEPATFPAVAEGVSFLLLDRYAAFFFLIFVLVALATCATCDDYLAVHGTPRGEVHATVLLATVGMMVMASAQDLLVLYLGLETMSLAAYVLTGVLVARPSSREAAIKYFLMGAFGSALFLYGTAFLYGASGSIALAGIGSAVAATDQPVYVMAGTALLLSGLGFKVAAVPFHMWAPDVYQGAPTPVTGLMAVGIKAAAFAALLRIVTVSLAPIEGPWVTVLLYALAVATMLWGNLAAVAQRNVKRMLAYSSIAHAGYLLIAVTVRNELSSPAILLYMLGYALMTLGAFAVVMLLERAGERHLDIDDYAGLVRRRPLLAVAMAIFLLSLAGIPPTVGFVGKWYVFAAAITRGFVTLTIIGVATSLISVYYYMRLVYLMFMKDGTVEPSPTEKPAVAAQVVAFGFAALVLLVGCFPGRFVEMARSAGLL